MNSAVKIIKRSKNEILTGLQSGPDEMTEQQSAREIVKTVKGWIADLHQRRRDEQLASSAFRKVRVTLSVLILSFWGLGAESDAQQLRDAFRRVEQAVVIVRTEQKGLAPFPQQGLVSLNGLGSGVLVSNDGKVLTAAHLVQAADRTVQAKTGRQFGNYSLSAKADRQAVNSHAVGFIWGVTAPCHLTVSGHLFFTNLIINSSCLRQILGWPSPILCGRAVASRETKGNGDERNAVL